MVYDLVIVGAGPSGLNCGISAKEAGLSYVILEKGVLVNTLYNFPANMTFFSTSKNLEVGHVPFISHTDKPTRREALEYYRRLVESYDISIQYRQEVLNITHREDHKEVRTDQRIFKAKYVVICTGFYDNPNLLQIPGEELPKVKHYYDDAHPYIGSKLAVIGAANSACDVALETWQKGADVTMIIRGDSLYEKVKYWILPNIQNRIKEGSIKAYFNANVISITETSIDIEQQGKKITLENDYVLAMTGYHPDYGFLRKMGIELKEPNQVPAHNSETLESNVTGIYLAGVVLGGDKTSTYFIENTRDQGERIIKDILVRI